MTCKHYSEIVYYKVYANLKAEASRGLLGFAWWVLEPMLYMAIFYLVFAVVFHRGGEGFVPFLLTGLTVWKWFNTSVQQGATSMLGGAGLMRQVYLPKHIFPLVVVFSNLFKFLIVLAILISFVLVYGMPISVSWLSLPLLVITQGGFIVAVTMLLSAVMPFFPDVEKILTNVLTLAMFVSGIFFDISKASPKVAFYSQFNPMATLIVNYRAVLLDGVWPNWLALSYISIVSFLGILLATWLIRRLDMIIPKALV